MAQQLLASLNEGKVSLVEETIEVTSDTCDLARPAFLVESVVATAGGSTGPLAWVENGATPGAGEVAFADDERQTLVFAAADAITEVVVTYIAASNLL